MELSRGWICPNCFGREYFATGVPTCVRCADVLMVRGNYCRDCNSLIEPDDPKAINGFCSPSCEMAYYDRARGTL